MKISECINKLYKSSAKINLYVSIASQKYKLYVDRFKNEIYQIKQIVAELEKITDML